MCLPDCYSMRFATLSNYHLSDWLIMQCLFVCLLDELILGFCYSDLTLETGGFEKLVDLSASPNRYVTCPSKLSQNRKRLWQNAYDSCCWWSTPNLLFMFSGFSLSTLDWIGLDWNALFRVNKIIEKNQINKCIIQVLSHINRYV